MDTIFGNLSAAKGAESNRCGWADTVILIVAIAACVFVWSSQCSAREASSLYNENQPENSLSNFEHRLAMIWGRNNVWVPTPKVWVQYESDLGERSAVDFENGVVELQILIGITDNPKSEIVLAHLRQGLYNLILGEPKDPVEMIKAINREAKEDNQAKKEVRVYIVRQGDSLWKIAKRFGMQITELAKMNEMGTDEILQVGRPLKVKVFSSHELTLDTTKRPMATHPLLIDQIRMTDGRPVPHWMVKEFVTEVVNKQPPGTENVIGEDGIERMAVVVSFKLVENHIEARARKFQPIVLTHAVENNLDPALIMAMIHTESFFNPRARSNAPAYGLMQVVPHTAGEEASIEIYGRKRRLTPQFLYDPANNIQLGTAYFNILKSRYMGSILDPTSRTYCAVAAYNAGASSVGRAFIPKKSINKATAVINSLKPKDVYDRLVNALPTRESRRYVRKVLTRVSKYSEWFSTTVGSVAFD